MTQTFPVTVTVNEIVYRRQVEPRLLLSDFLRHELGLTGTHVGCEHGVCGACTILFDGESARSCLMLVPFLRQNPDPTEDEIRHALSGNLCRCTGYQHIVDAVKLAAEKMR